ncbi:MAG: cysteine desulfurase [Desulfobacterales bacterium]|nr:cysteine desulfurase [Desulfobacterales bacterium]
MLNNYTKTYINQMSRRTGIYITELHLRVLEYAHSYYEANKVGPLYDNIEKNTGVTKNDIDEIFPHGINSVYTWVGIPIHSIDDSCKPIADIEVPENEARDVYFDHNGTTYIRDEVKKYLVEYSNGNYGYGNPSSSTFLGKKAFEHVTTARKEIASCMGADPSEITFTASGSEANNLAIKGIAFKYHETKGHIITTQIEHSSITESVQFLGMLGYDVTFIDVDNNGRITVDAVKDALRYDTLLVAAMAVNNEIGTINPIAEIGEVCRLAEIPFIVDAIQAFGKIELNPKEMGISLMSISGHKLYAPKGIGALYIDKMLSIVPLVHGGGQEFNRRSGTENVGHIISFGKAAKIAHKEMDSEYKRLTKIRDYFLEQLKEKVPGHIVNGSMEERVPHNLNIGFPGIDSGTLLISLNKIGVYVSSGSSCSSGSKEGSPIIKALGVDTEYYGTIRFSFGQKTTKEDVDYLFKYLPDILEQIKDDKDKK